MAHHLTGLVMHRHDAVGMADGHASGQTGFAGDQRLKLRLVAMKQELRVGGGAGTNAKTGNDSCRSAISTHRIDGNDDAPCACG